MNSKSDSSEGYNYISYSGEDAGIDSGIDTYGEAVEIYNLLFRLETSDESGAAFIADPGERLARLLGLQSSDGSVFCGSAGDLDAPAWMKIISACACFTAAAASACCLIDDRRESAFLRNFPDFKKLFRAALAGGSSLKEKLPDDISSFNGGASTVSHCYWAFAALFRLTGCSEWLSLCSRFEAAFLELSGSGENGMDAEPDILKSPPKREDMSAAAVWALFKRGGAEYYKKQLELIYGADNEIWIL